MNIVLIETSGNQRYIFATNKLRENVGASELTYRVGTQFVLEVVGRSYDYEADVSGKELRKLLLNETRIEDSTYAGAVEIIVATSGKAILLTKNRAKAEEVVSEVTKRAVTNMPGLTVHGSIWDVEPDLTDIHKAISEVHRRLETVRYQMPSNEQRFLRLPFVAPCATSGLPASKVFKLGIDTYAFSEVTVVKRSVLGDAGKKYEENTDSKRGRIIDLLEQTFNLTLPKNLGEFEKAFPQSEWLAVIHADGNGLGEIFTKFDKHLNLDKDAGTRDFKDKDEARKYLDAYRKFSIALDICTINATVFALKSLQNLFAKGKTREDIPIIPLILGGDDLTVLCDGKYALKFTKDFLTQFEKESEELSTEFLIEGTQVKLDYLKEIVGALQGIIPKIANNAFGNQDESKPSVKRLGICAGVTIVKPHYPFHQAYELAEQLLRSAKQVKEEIKRQRKNEKGEDEKIQLPSSALDFHILYDSAHSELTEIRDGKLKVGDKTYLSTKPYVVTESLDGQEQNLWLKYRRFEELRKRVEAMSAPDEDDRTRRALPNSKLHEIRQSLFRGREVADVEAGLVKKRLKTEQARSEFKKLLIEDSLFFEADANTYTHFLDAIEVVDFWEGFDGEETKPVGENKQKAEPAAENEVTK